MTESKGFGSNAHIWARLKHPELLRTYLNIAEKLGLSMHIKPIENFEYDPTRTYVPWPVPLFTKPYNNPDNIIIARDMIAKHLSDHGLSLELYVDYRDLNPVHEILKSEKWRLPVRDYIDGASFGKSLAAQPTTANMLRSEFTQPLTMDNLRFEHKWQRRAIDRLDPLPESRTYQRAILKSNYYTVCEPENDYVNIEDPKIKYKSSWQQSSYVLNSEERYNLRSRTPTLSVESDDQWSDIDFDSTIG